MVGSLNANVFSMLLQVVSGWRRAVGLHSILIIFVSTIGSFSGRCANNVTLAWNPSSSSDVVGYNLYYGAATAAYTNMVEVGNATNVTITSRE